MNEVCQRSNNFNIQEPLSYLETVSDNQPCHSDFVCLPFSFC